MTTPTEVVGGVLESAIVRCAGLAVVSVDAHACITSWNPAAADLFGFSPSEALGRSLALVFPPTSDPLATLARLREDELGWSEVRWQHKDGRWLELGSSVTLLSDEAGHAFGTVLILRDMTADVLADRSLADAKRELEEKNRRIERSNADLEQFAYVASHDLSEPLRAVAGMVALLARRYKGRLDPDADDFISFAVDGCERMRAMIEDLLAYSRLGRVELRHEPVDMKRVLDEVRSMLSSQLESAGATITEHDMPVVDGDKTQLTRVLQNLLSNAVKFRRADSPLVIDVSSIHQPGDGWRFEVTDNGIGVDPEFRDRIFRMFQRLHTSDKYPGTGIGLAISERLVDRWGGAMGVDGNSLGGSTFWFTVPQQ